MSTKPKIPGVFLTPVAPQTRPSLLTGVPLFLGLASARETVNEPIKLTLKTHFEQYFEAQGYLKEAIEGFFINGGRLCYAIALESNTIEALQQGLLTSETIDEIDLVCAPDIMLLENEQLQRRLQIALLEHCQQTGDRFAILDGANDWQQLERQREELLSHNGALYAPWLKIENRTEAIPPCGHIAGIYAASDRAIGIHNPTANMALEGVLDLSFAITPTQQQKLNPDRQPGVNCICSFRGRGIRVWGVRTLSELPQWQYINVRRLFLTFKRWVDRNLADLVFEPNVFPLWVRLERELKVYCESLWRQGALQGVVPQEAFYVRCNEQTNPPKSQSAGQVRAEIGLAPTVPGEFIQLLLVQSDGEITFV